MTFINPSNEEIYSILEKAKRIAVVGLSNKPERTSYHVSQVMQSAGYEIIPVNPVLAGQKILGETVYATLQEVPGQIDIVDIFRRSEFLLDIAKEFNKIDADVFWAQLGIEDEETATYLKEHGHQVIMNRCIKIEYGKMNEVK
ncbi:CoA-binding protein [Isobaculum melis]|uniref:CoA-binding domain-containing protein n=1 Tax=Isobaculum melis TaxID=142588 RepID=A0A1H9SYJ5_9LACT|nr:CoA-binding protein [Isobaculum melis]SER90072.1 hypothetical protein SAMN04488559_1102 [Isobaculum melis]